MKTFYILFFLFVCMAFAPRKKYFYYFPEYKFYYTPDSCTEETYQTINGFKYLKIKFIKNCKEVEVGCYRDVDSSLMEKGGYKSGNLESQKVISRNVSGDKSKMKKSYHYKLTRIGNWEFYDSTGNITRSIEYK